MLRTRFRPTRLALPWLWVVTALVYAFLFLPIVMIVIFSFSAGATTRFPITRLTIDGYIQAFSDPVITDALRNSAIVAAGAMLLTAVLGTPAALALARYRPRWARPARVLINLPLVIPVLILAVGLLSFYTTMAVPLSLATVVLAHAMYALPFVVLVLVARLADLDPALMEAARDLGAGPVVAFRRVVFPLIRSSLVGAMVLVFAISFDEFVIALFTIGPESTLPLVIWSMLKKGTNTPASLGALSTLLLLATTGLLALASRFTRLSVDVR
jgi:spermidine/putrescine transport system permease protein